MIIYSGIILNDYDLEHRFRWCQVPYSNMGAVLENSNYFKEQKKP